jgi:hypothetical protein
MECKCGGMVTTFILCVRGAFISHYNLLHSCYQSVIKKNMERLSEIFEKTRVTWSARPAWLAMTSVKQALLIRPAHRSILVDWMLDVVTDMGRTGQPAFVGLPVSLDLDVFFLSVQILDLYLKRASAEDVSTSSFQLCGATALLLAWKLTSVEGSGVDEFLHLCNRQYTARQIREKEAAMFCLVHPDICNETLLDQLQQRHSTLPLSHLHLRRTLHHCELAVVADADQSTAVLDRCLRLGRKRSTPSAPEGERLTATYRRHV